MSLNKTKVLFRTRLNLFIIFNHPKLIFIYVTFEKYTRQYIYLHKNPQFDYEILG